MPSIEPRDALETLLLFPFDVKFVDKIGPEEEALNAEGRFWYIEKDPLINNFYEREDVAMECFHMIMDAYRDTTKYVPQSVRDEAISFNIEEDPKCVLLGLIEITKNPADFVPGKTMFKLCTDEDLRLQAPDIKHFLKIKGATYKQSGEKHGRVYGFSGVIIKGSEFS
jgi:hypothetical protein